MESINSSNNPKIIFKKQQLNYASMICLLNKDCSGILNRISNTSELNDLLKKVYSNKYNITKLIFFNKKYLSEMLDKNNEIYEIDSKIINKDLSNYFYLDLLIDESILIVDYSFSFVFINEINELNKKEEINLRKIIISKIIIDFINYYKNGIGTDINEEIDILKEENNNIFWYLIGIKDILYINLFFTFIIKYLI